MTNLVYCLIAYPGSYNMTLEGIFSTYKKAVRYANDIELDDFVIQSFSINPTIEHD